MHTISKAIVTVVATLAFIATLLVAPQATAEAHHTSTHHVNAEQLFVELINEARADAGVGPVAFRTDIWEVAYGWSTQMGETRVFAHSPTYAADICCWTVISENVAWRSDASQSSAQKVRSLHAALMNSPGHRANILDGRVSDVGIGVWYDGQRMYITQNFRRPTSTAPQDSDYPGGVVEPDPEPELDPGRIDHARVAGLDRYTTATELSAATFDAGSAETVLVARGDHYADALAGASLAAAHGAPLLLTRPDRLTDEFTAELDRLGADRVILLGGAAAITDELAGTIGGLLGGTVDRIAGTGRFETAAAIADEVVGAGRGGHAYIALGSHPNPDSAWPDAVAASFLAAAESDPLLLVQPDAVPAATLDAIERLDIDRVTLVGGPGAISDTVARRFASEGVRVDRLWGQNRYETSAAVVERAMDLGHHPSRLWVATGRSFPDALAAGPAVAHHGGVLMLVDGRRTADATLDWIDQHGHLVDALRVVGAEGAISTTAEAEILRALNEVDG